MSTTILVPIARPPSYAPAWDEKTPGLRVVRTLDLGDLMADRALHLTAVAVLLDPPLLADTFDVTPTSVSFVLSDNPPAAPGLRFRVRFDLTYSDGTQDEIVGYQPIGAAPPTGQVAADPTATSLSIGGELITVGGEGING